MKRLREAERADLLLTALRATSGSIVGYAAAADLIEWRGETVERPMAQVCSRLDLAAFNAGLPMLALNKVQMKDGSINKNAFSGTWEKYRDEIEREMQSYCWQQQDYDRLQTELDRLPNRSARKLWEQIDAEEISKPGFIRSQLHRSIRSDGRPEITEYALESIYSFGSRQDEPDEKSFLQPL